MGFLKLNRYRFRLKFTADLLGTVPKSKDVYGAHIATKLQKEAAKREGVVIDRPGQSATPDEVAAQMAAETADVPEVEERGWTGFLTDRDGRYLSGHMLKGFLCNSGLAQREIGPIKQLKSKVKRFVAIIDKKIRLPQYDPSRPYGGDNDMVVPSESGPTCPRPLRELARL